jgi:hypothetical protein
MIPAALDLAKWQARSLLSGQLAARGRTAEARLLARIEHALIEGMREGALSIELDIREGDVSFVMDLLDDLKGAGYEISFINEVLWVSWQSAVGRWLSNAFSA